MTNNCLKTQLKGVVSDNNLPVLGMIKIKVKVESDSIAPRLAAYGVNDLLEITLFDDGVTFSSAIGQSVVIDSKHAKISKTYGSKLYLSGASENDWINVGYSPKYDITNIGRNSDGINLADLSYIDGLTVLTPKTNSLTFGKLDYLSRCSNLTTIDLSGNTLSGNIAALGTLTNLQTLGLSISHSDYSGNFSDFVAAQKANGRTSCDSLVLYSPTGLKIGFGNKPAITDGTIGENATMKWNGNKISLQWDTSKIVWVIGYSQSEAESAFPGYSVTLCD